MSTFLIFILVMILGVLPLSILIYWFKYRGTVLYKTAYAILITNLLVSIASFLVGMHGTKFILLYLPVGYIALFVGNAVFKKFVQKPIKGSIEALEKVSQGDLNIKISDEIKKSNDETGYMNIALDELITGLKETAEFAKQVGDGNLDYNIDLLSESDHLRTALIAMKQKLKDAKSLQEEKGISL